jgi:hypothetical protein
VGVGGEERGPGCLHFAARLPGDVELSDQPRQISRFPRTAIDSPPSPPGDGGVLSRHFIPLVDRGVDFGSLALSLIYDNQCAACHGAEGQGIVGLFPRLAGVPVVQQQQATSLIRVVLEGSRAVATAGAPTGPAMPSFDWGAFR